MRTTGKAAFAIATVALVTALALYRTVGTVGAGVTDAAEGNRDVSSVDLAEGPRPPQSATPVLDKEAIRATLEKRRGFLLVPSAQADLAREDLRDVVQRLLDRAKAGDAAANRQLSDIVSECDSIVRMAQRLEGVEREIADRALDASKQCAGLDAAIVGKSGDRLLAAAEAGDIEARLRLPGQINHLSGDAARRNAVRAQALSYLKQLARANDGRAVLALAQQAASGQLMARDYVVAYAYYELALPRLPPMERRGVEYSMQLLRNRLNEDELRRAKALENTQLFD